LECLFATWEIEVKKNFGYLSNRTYPHYEGIPRIITYKDDKPDGMVRDYFKSGKMKRSVMRSSMHNRR
jgi:hypothetical protein